MIKLLGRTIDAWRVVSAILLTAMIPSSPQEARAEDPHRVTTRPMAYRPLPFLPEEGGGPLLSSDEGMEVALPFPFKYFGRTYSNALLSKYGYVTFGSLANAQMEGSANNGFSWSNDEIPSRLEDPSPSRFIALWWMNLQCRPVGRLKTQVLQVTLSRPKRQFVMEWSNCFPLGGSSNRGGVNMQLWLTEGSQAIETRYGTLGSLDQHYTASVGISDREGEAPAKGYVGLDCTPTCTAHDWPTDTSIVYSQEPDLVVEAVEVPHSSYAGARIALKALVGNLGQRSAHGVSLRFHLSRTPDLSVGSIELGTGTDVSPVAGTFSPRPTGTVSRGEVATFFLDVRLPTDLGIGTWYVVAVADPFAEIPDPDRSNNHAPSPPIWIGDALPELEVVEVLAPEELAPGERFWLSWKANNLGAAPAVSVPYSVRLSSDDLPSLTDLELGSGHFNLEALHTSEHDEPLTLPLSVPPGTYYLGVLLDPSGSSPRIVTANDRGVSDPVRIGTPKLTMRTQTLPAAELGSPWSISLEAEGANGSYRWTAGPGSSLPPGLLLQELRPAIAGRSSTVLQGRPSRLGQFRFTLQVHSAGSTVTREFILDVLPTSSSPSVSTWELPVAEFGSAYRGKLSSSGGAAPYTWSLAMGSLPEGLHLEPLGLISGAPNEIGSFPFTVEVTDSNGVRDRTSLVLLVRAPSSLRCLNQERVSLRRDEAYQTQLHALGGMEPYRWKSYGTQRASTGTGDHGGWSLLALPPGLSLHEDGSVRGVLNEVGHFVWLVEVFDATGSRASCMVLLDITDDQGLSILTQGLMPASAGHPYHAVLGAVGAVGEVSWRLLPGSQLPMGLELETATGILHGVAPSSEAGVHSFVVEAIDSSNARALAPLSIDVQGVTTKGEVRTSGSQTKSQGCGAGTQGSAGSGLIATAALTRALSSRRRQPSELLPNR